MANFGNVQNLPFAFFPLPPSIISKRWVPGQRSGSKALSERYQVPTKVRVNLTNGSGKIKSQILVPCKIRLLPFFHCRHTLFLQHLYSSTISCTILSGEGYEKFSRNVSGANLVTARGSCQKRWTWEILRERFGSKALPKSWDSQRRGWWDRTDCCQVVVSMWV